MKQEEKKFTIPFYVLRRVFPTDTMWVDGCAEIIGYSKKENLHIVISDGTRTSFDGKYLVHEYRPKDKSRHEKSWNSGKYPMKYLIDDDYADVVSERVVDFSKL